MGNCSPIGISGDNNGSNSIRVLTDSGSVLEFKPPKSAHEVLNFYPDHRIFLRGHGTVALGGDEKLLVGKSYYLLPLTNRDERDKSLVNNKSLVNKKTEAEYIATAETETGKAFVQDLSKEPPGVEVLPSCRDGFWRVKLVIDPKRLEEILSEQGNTGDLIERMRVVAGGSACVTPRHDKSGWKSNLSSLFNKIGCDSKVNGCVVIHN